MTPMTGKARDLTIFGGTMAVCSLAWLVIGEARSLAAWFVVFGVFAVAQGLFAWAKPQA